MMANQRNGLVVDGKKRQKMIQSDYLVKVQKTEIK